MQPMDTRGRRRLAAERFEFLRDDARSSMSSTRRVRPGFLFGPLRLSRHPRPEARVPGETVSTSPRSRCEARSRAT